MHGAQKDDIRAQGEDGHAGAKEGGLEQRRPSWPQKEPICRHLALGHLASRPRRQYMLCRPHSLWRIIMAGLANGQNVYSSGHFP